MDEHDDWLTQRFEENRTHLRAVGYRMLGSISEADDAVQEAWLRLSRSDTSGVENLGGWLTTVVGRVCLNMLRSRRSRREGALGEPQLGVHVPDPIVDREDGIDPEHEALLADSIGLALLVVLETLSPAERLAFVLHDMFGGALRRDRADRRPHGVRRGLVDPAPMRVRAAGRPLGTFTEDMGRAVRGASGDTYGPRRHTAMLSSALAEMSQMRGHGTSSGYRV